MKRTAIAAVILLAGISAAAAARDISPPIITTNLLDFETHPTSTPDVNDLIDSAPTSAIPPAGTAPLIVPNDPPGISIEPPPILTPPATTVPLTPMPVN